MSHFSLMLASTILALWAGMALQVRGEDIVQYVHPSNDRAVRASGQILSYTAAKLRMRTATGREAVISASRVRSIDSDWTAEQVEADQLFAQNRPGEALSQYRLAYRTEKRTWVRQRIMARIVWCYRWLGQFEQAGDVFAQLVRQIPDTPYLDAMPLVWQAYQPSPGLERRARTWLRSADSPAVAVMGASWLLSGRDSLLARQMLQKLLGDQDPRIAMIARTQLWRGQVVRATAADVARWQSMIEHVPVALRPGPYFVLGKALASHERLESAALTLLRVPVLYPEHRMLAAEALLAAGRLLERLDQTAQARRLYQEVAEQYNHTDAADLARQQIARLSQGDSD